MIEKRCPLCGKTKCYSSADSNTNAIAYHCDTFYCSVYISNSIEDLPNYDQKLRMYNLIFEHSQKCIMDGRNHLKYYYNPNHVTTEHDETDRINLAEIPYPKTLIEKADRSLMNFSRRLSDYSDTFMGDSLFCRAVFAENIGEEQRVGFFNVLVDIGYLKKDPTGLYSISAKGWQRVDELTRRENAVKQGFIAMKFSDETQSIFDAIKKAIIDSGYHPLRIDEKEHNNQIVPEIFYEIDQSRFLVMDVTVPNYGAYYEAGYALGKGKPVIICCRKNVFVSVEKPHFDIQQKSTIVWETEEELVERLVRRINATVI